MSSVAAMSAPMSPQVPLPMPPPLSLPISPPMSPPMSPAAGWYSDPGDLSGVRYWNGLVWTADTAFASQWVYQPQQRRHRRESFTPLPIQAAVAAVLVTIVSLIASKFLLQWLVRYEWPILVYAMIGLLSAYGPMLWSCWWISRKWGTGRLRDDVGLKFRAVDCGWGPLAWLSAVLAQVIVALAVFAFDVPVSSNTEGISRHHLDRAYILSFALLAMVAAPIVEELVFRGLIMRGLRSALPAWLSIGVQGVLFGAAHYDPARGMGNVGLVLILSAVGVVLGGAAYLVRRLAPTMIAHALFNTLVFVLMISR